MTRHGCSSSVCSPYRFTIPCRFELGTGYRDLDMDNIVTYVRQEIKMSAKWSEVSKDIKDATQAWESRRRSGEITGRRGRPSDSS